MTDNIITEVFVGRFQEWEPRIDREHLIWITWALAVNPGLQLKFDSVIGQIKDKLRHEMKKLDDHSP